jgi:hypothetical protein
MLLAQMFHHRRAGHIKHHDVELREHLLRVQQVLGREGGFGWGRLQGELTPPAEHFGNHHGRERDFGLRHAQEIQAYGGMPLAKGPEDVRVPQIHTR